MLSELPANSFVYCVSSRITLEVVQVASQLFSNSVLRILWVTLNFFRVASQLDSFLCFGFCELHWTCFELPARLFLWRRSHCAFYLQANQHDKSCRTELQQRPAKVCSLLITLFEIYNCAIPQAPFSRGNQIELNTRRWIQEKI